ncbi:MAG: zinc-ribbon domain-containing protein [Pseudomonadota bacterium]|uniref:Zinc-ribbon domain-containing protein n=1 Tax=Candidatus Desulfatibia profunda TaxID=2841695 RepID=A0A8J6NV44_9BACT|nr:zinc-ribbon domain-containing protein [Candidatus Desulfatibia profunda]MBL7178961.1 zinc-ribbon domain-containing protein [Desulfobacterales bacterium]
MDVVCDKCQGKFKIPDEKVPKGQVFSVACPKCQNKISIDTRTDAPPAPAAGPKPPSEKTLLDEVGAGSYDADEKPFDFLEEGAKTALLCEQDAGLQAKIRTALQNMGYSTTVPASARDVLKQMRFHVFDIVMLNERFDSPNPDMNNVLRYLDQLPMSTRRHIFVALFTERFRTMDNMVAFNKSVNIVVNLKNIDDFEKILRRGVADYEAFYRVFKQSLTKIGKI